MAPGTPPLGTGSSGKLGNNAETANLHPPYGLSDLNFALLFTAHGLEKEVESAERLSQSQISTQIVL